MTTHSAPDRANFDFVELTSFQITVSPHFTAWLAEQQVSLALTNTLGHKLFMIGLKPDGRLSVVDSAFDRCMGLVAVDSHTLYLVTRYQIWRLENALPPGQLAEGGYDRLYLPQMAYTTGFVNIHDIAVAGAGQLIFVNTRFACLATVSPRDNFIPLWRPSFIAELIPGDPCHLNGLAMRAGQPAYVTSFSQTATPEGWREERLNGGSVMEVASRQLILTGLVMPHSPRFYRDRLWLANSGAGQFGWVDLARGRFEPVAWGAGFLRGLDFYGDFAVVGSSKPRHGSFFAGLPLQDRLNASGLEPQRGLYIIDLRSGEIVHWLRLEGVIGEIYDVVVLPGVRRPMAISLQSDEIQRLVTVGPPGALEEG